jgi:hypothetical protein
MSGQLYDAPNQEAVGGDPPWVEGSGGSPEGEPTQQPTQHEQESKLPGQHRGLDELAAERGHSWSRDDLTVQEKQQELEG